MEPPQEGVSPTNLWVAIADLHMALRMASTSSPAQSDQGRAGVRIALVGVINLLSELYPDDQSLARPLNELLYGLVDLDRGKVVFSSMNLIILIQSGRPFISHGPKA
jgi:hypothetical protein